MKEFAWRGKWPYRVKLGVKVVKYFRIPNCANLREWNKEQRITFAFEATMAFCDIFFLWSLNQVYYNKVWDICDWIQGPGALRVSESRIVDTTDWNKLHDEQYNVDSWK